jgi:GNAT superfamily N-acetyltransferase
VSLYGQYLKERENIDIFEVEQGFGSYMIEGEQCYIRDIFVTKEHRKAALATYIADEITKIARAAGCTYLTGTVVPSAAGANTSMKVLIGYGMSLHSSTNDLIVFKKDIGGL